MCWLRWCLCRPCYTACRAAEQGRDSWPTRSSRVRNAPRPGPGGLTVSNSTALIPPGPEQPARTAAGLNPTAIVSTASVAKTLPTSMSCVSLLPSLPRHCRSFRFHFLRCRDSVFHCAITTFDAKTTVPLLCVPCTGVVKPFGFCLSISLL